MSGGSGKTCQPLVKRWTVTWERFGDDACRDLAEEIRRTISREMAFIVQYARSEYGLIGARAGPTSAGSHHNGVHAHPQQRSLHSYGRTDSGQIYFDRL